jgi:hypothetical protein
MDYEVAVCHPLEGWFFQCPHCRWEAASGQYVSCTRAGLWATSPAYTCGGKSGMAAGKVMIKQPFPALLREPSPCRAMSATGWPCKQVIAHCCQEPVVDTGFHSGQSFPVLYMANSICGCCIAVAPCCMAIGSTPRSDMLEQAPLHVQVQRI